MTMSRGNIYPLEISHAFLIYKHLLLENLTIDKDGKLRNFMPTLLIYNISQQLPMVVIPVEFRSRNYFPLKT
jgi:hypothetical protein